MENAVEENNLLSEEPQWRQELRKQQSQVDALHEKLVEVKANIMYSEDESRKELEHLCRWVKTIMTLLAYLKSKARIMAVPHLARISCGITLKEGIGLVDKHGIPLSDWSKDIDLTSYGSLNDETFDVNGGDIDDIIKSVHIVTDVMEALVKRVLMAETEAVDEKEKVKLGLDEIRRKTVQIEDMSVKVEEMEVLALGTNNLLNEMRQRVGDMAQETSRQRQRAAENEQELCRVKQDFESLRSYVSTLISARETILSSEQQYQMMEKLFDRLDAKNANLENEKVQKEAEVQKLMEENVRLRARLDMKEAQLLALNEQCKFMALNKP